MSDDEFERERAKWAKRREAARGPFDKWREFLHLKGYGIDVTAFKRAETAQRAVREWREASNQGGPSCEQLCLAIRVAADTFASQVEAAGQGRYDDATIRWVVAGLRCPSQPFCMGCDSCQTVTAPERVAVSS